MKVRHMGTVVWHHPAFLFRNGLRMLAHTFRGTTWRSAVGLETARDVFRRYREIRRGEREYLRWPDTLPSEAAHLDAQPSRSENMTAPSAARKKSSRPSRDQSGSVPPALETDHEFPAASGNGCTYTSNPRPDLFD